MTTPPLSGIVDHVGGMYPPGKEDMNSIRITTEALTITAGQLALGDALGDSMVSKVSMAPMVKLGRHVEMVSVELENGMAFRISEDAILDVTRSSGIEEDVIANLMVGDVSIAGARVREREDLDSGEIRIYWTTRLGTEQVVIYSNPTQMARLKYRPEVRFEDLSI